MKKLVKVWLILLMFGVFGNINVIAITQKDNTSDETIVPPPPVSTGIVENIKINGQIVVCDSENNTCEYNVEDNSISKVVIEYTTNDGASSKTEKEIKAGVNNFNLTITAKSGETVEYKIIVTKNVKSTDSSLQKLTINGEEISLKSGTNKYSTTVSFSTNKLEVEATPTDSKAKIDGANKNKLYYDLFENTKNIQIKVIAESGDVTTYVITVTKREEADVTLKTLKIKGATIDFESNVYDYELTVLKSVQKLEIEAVPTDSKAVVTITGNEKPLEMGENDITIEVLNDGNKKTYNLKVTRLDMEDDSVANLKSLKIKGYDLDFKETKYEYDLKIGDVNYLDLDYETLNPDAKVEVTGNVDLVNGSIIKIKVTYDDEITNIYRINITKNVVEEKESNSFLIVIIIVIVLIIILGVIITILIIKKKNKNNKNAKNLKSKKNINNSLKEETKKESQVISSNADRNPSDVVNLDDTDDDII